MNPNSTFYFISNENWADIYDFCMDIGISIPGSGLESREDGYYLTGEAATWWEGILESQEGFEEFYEIGWVSPSGVYHLGT